MGTILILLSLACTVGVNNNNQVRAPCYGKVLMQSAMRTAKPKLKQSKPGQYSSTCRLVV